MFDFVYYLLYNRNLKDGVSSARYNAALVVGLVIWEYLIFVAILFKTIYFTREDNERSHHWYANYKPLVAVFYFLIVLLSYLYYNKPRIERLVAKYNKGEPFKDTGNKQLKLVLIMGVPVVIAGVIMKIYWDRFK